VQKDGTLITGIIPFARITGYTPPSFNNVTLTGTTTMTGPVIMDSTLQVYGTSEFESPATFNDDVTTNNLTVTGSFTPPGGAPLGDIPSYTTSTFVMPTTGSSATIAVQSTHGFPVGVCVQIYGPGSSGPVNFKGIVTANNGTPQTSITIDTGTIITGTPGETVNVGAVCTPSAQVKVESSDSSITIANAGTAADPIIDLIVTPVTPPTYPQGSCYIASAQGLSFTVTIPGSPTESWAAFLIANVITTAAITSGFVQVEGTGTTVGSPGTGWNSGITQTSNPNQPIVPLQLGGIVKGGDSLTATFSATGGTIASSGGTVFANRLS
jgi:hypothetical protein